MQTKTKDYEKKFKATTITFSDADTAKEADEELKLLTSNSPFLQHTSIYALCYQGFTAHVSIAVQPKTLRNKRRVLRAKIFLNALDLL